MTASTSLAYPGRLLSLAGAPDLHAGFTDAHFTAWEEPELFSADVRAGVRSLRR